MFKHLCSLFKAIPKLIGFCIRFAQSCLKGLALVLLCAILANYFLESLPGPAIRSTQEVENLPALQPSDVYKPERSLVRIYIEKQFYCTGVVIGNNYVLTASHCLVDHYGRMRDVELKIESDDSTVVVKARAVGVNLRLDWGLIHGDFHRIPGAHLISTRMEVPAVVGACGFPQGSHIANCETLAPVINDGFLIKCAGHQLQPGMSGGPVFDGAGNVIGLNVQVYDSREGGGSAYSPTIGILSAFHIGD